MSAQETRSRAAGPAVALVALVVAGASGWLVLRAVRSTGAPAPVEIVRNESLADAFRSRDDRMAEPGFRRPEDALGRLELTPALARMLDATIDGRRRVFDEYAVYVKRPGLSHRVEFPEHPRGEWRVWTNSLGLRGPEPRETVGRRVVVTGDSHVEGACRLEDRVTERLQEELDPDRERVEVVNAGVGGYGFYHYVGTLERLAHLDPDVFVAVVYGGNDFSNGLELHHFHRGTWPPKIGASHKRRIRQGMKVSEVGLAQAFRQLVYLDEFPEERAAMLDMAARCTRELARRCEELGARLVVVYLPPLLDVQRERYEPYVSSIAAAMELDEESLGATDALVDEWISEVRELGVEVLDLRPAFAAATAPLYWESDHHINREGHALLADLLRPHVRTEPRREGTSRPQTRR